MAQAGLLADLATMLAASPEDVATRGLELLLVRSQAANKALNQLLDSWNGGGPRPFVSRWASQVVGQDRSRTDLQGFSESGETVAVLENKFWASLTDNQPGAYLERLKTPGSILVFVVPDSRVRIITHEVGLRLALLGSERLAEGWSGETALLTRPSSPPVVVTSWSVVLSAIASAMEGAAEYDNHADLRQLQALADRMDREGFRPFRQTDLTGESPRLLLRLGGLVDETVQLVLTAPYANKKGLKASAGLGWYGHYLRIHGYGCQILFAAQRWAQHGISPLWLRVSSSDWKFPAHLGAPLRAAVTNEKWLFEEQGGYWIALRILEDRERDAVIADLHAQVQRIAKVLGIHPERETDAAPPDAG